MQWTKKDWIKAGVYVGVLVVLACIGLCGCDTDETGLQPCESIATDAGAARLDADPNPNVLGPPWQTGLAPPECAAIGQQHYGVAFRCPTDYACWDRVTCMCKNTSTCVAKAMRDGRARDCICTGMPGDWNAL